MATTKITALWLGKGFNNFLAGIEAGANQILEKSKFRCIVKKAKHNPDGTICQDMLQEANVLLPSIFPVNDSFLKQVSQSTKLIFQPAAGYDSIDLAACKMKGLPVINAPGLNSRQTAELTLTLILLAMRKISINFIRSAYMQNIGSPTGLSLFKKKVCIIGRGSVGKELCKILSNGFDCTVSFVTSKTSRVEFMKLLSAADVVSINCALTPKTRGLITNTELNVMKRRAVLINTARADIVSKEDVFYSLKARHLSFYAADVFWNEPANNDDQFFALDNCFFTPHIAASTYDHHLDLGKQLGQAIQTVFSNSTNIDTLPHRLA